MQFLFNGFQKMNSPFEFYSSPPQRRYQQQFEESNNKKRLYQNRSRKHPPNKRFGKIMSLPHCQNRRCLETKRWLKMHTRWISDRDKYLPKRKYHLYWLFCLSIVVKPDLASCTFGLYYKKQHDPFDTSKYINTSTWRTFDLDSFFCRIFIPICYCCCCLCCCW